MPTSLRGRVDSIDRTTGFLRATLESGTSVTAAYGGQPPPPFSTCLFTQNGPSWFCRRMVGTRRLVFHDDFTHVGAVGIVPRLGDTPWTFPVLGGDGTASQVGDSTGAVGALRLTTNDGNTTIGITKTNQPPVDGLGYWLSGRVRSDAYNNNEVTFAFRTADGAGFAGIYMSDPLNSTTRWLVAAASSAGPLGFAQEFDGNDALSDTWQYVDLVFVGGQFIAGWINGNGPGVIDDPDRVPEAAADILAPTFMVRARAVPAARSADIDWMRFETFDVAEDALA